MYRLISIALMMTCAPRAASLSAVALPIPLVEPVISAVLPLKSVVMLIPSIGANTAIVSTGKWSGNYKTDTVLA